LNATGYQLLDVAATSTVPSIVSDQTDTDTGIGHDGANQLVVIAGGSEVCRFIQAPGSLEQLIVPTQAADPNPSIAFGDGDTGFFESSDDVLRISIGGAATWEISGSDFGGIGAGGTLRNITPSSTLPSVLPHLPDLNTGMGLATLDALSFTCGGIEALRLTEVSSAILQAHQTDSGITAAAGSSQGDGVIISTYNVYSTVATTGDAATLPSTFIEGALIYVKNDGANSMDVFPASGDDLGEGTNTVLAVAAGGRVLFLATTANATWTQLIPLDASSAGSGVSDILGHSGAGSTISKGSTDFIGFGSGVVNATIGDTEYYVPIAGTIQNLRTFVSTNASNNCGNTVTIYLNGSAQSLLTTYAASGTGLQSDTSNSFAVVAGDRLAIEVVNTGSGGGTKNIVLETVTMELAA